MISVRFDASGANRMQWPKSAADILALGQTYVAHESSLPAGQQLILPNLALIQAAHTAAQNAQTAANSGEISRASAAETYRQSLVTAKQRLDVALVRLKLSKAGNLADLEQWGLDTIASGGGVKVRKPRTDGQWEAFLNGYVSKESSLPVNQQLTDPPLAEMTTLRTTMQTAKAARADGRNQREVHTETRTAEAQRLLDLLQTAAVNMVITRHNGVVTNALQAWGYRVTAVAEEPAS